MWFDLPAALATRHRVVAYDRRSFGESVHPPVSIASPHVEGAAAILDALDAGAAIVLGWSRGGVLALELALSRSRRAAARLPRDMRRRGCSVVCSARSSGPASARRSVVPRRSSVPCRDADERDETGWRASRRSCGTRA
jgi:pimeloyl-ACP methyl ester carboxylesterase